VIDHERFTMLPEFNAGGVDSTGKRKAALVVVDSTEVGLNQ